jgi:hypothetical protein
MLAVMLGQGIKLRSYDVLVYRIPQSALVHNMQLLKNAVAKTAAALPAVRTTSLAIVPHKSRKAGIQRSNRLNRTADGISCSKQFAKRAATGVSDCVGRFNRSVTLVLLDKKGV